MLSVKQVAERLNLSPQCIYTLIDSGRLPAHRFGVGRGTIRVSLADLEAFINQSRLKRDGERRETPPRPRLKHINLRPSSPGPASA